MRSSARCRGSGRVKLASMANVVIQDHRRRNPPERPYISESNWRGARPEAILLNIRLPGTSAPQALKESPMKIRPLHDRVIVKRLDQEKKTASGIVIPDTAAEKPDQGEVMSVGKGKLTDEGNLVPLDVKVGDRVLFGKYSGQTVTLKGDELLVMREEDILGIVEGQP